MKIKGFMILSVLIFLLFPLISAVEFNLNNNFSQGETIITKLSGNFLTSVTKDNVFFYQGHVKIPVDYGITKINNDYYLYASLSGKQQGNYSISIENVKYMKGTEVISDNIVRNFTITNSTADFSLKPGVVVSSEDFFLELQNLQDRGITIDVKTQTTNNSERSVLISTPEATAKTASVSLVSGEVGKIYFKLGDGLPTFQIIEFKSGNLTYEVPVYIFTSSATQEAAYRLEPSQLIDSIPTNSVTKRIIFLYNTGNSEIKNISLSLSDSISPFVNLSQYSIQSLTSKSNIPIELSFFSPGELEVSGTLKANINGEIMLYSQISLKFLNNYVPSNETQQSSEKTCAELQGRICSSEQTCDKKTVYAKDNVCCLGNCKSPRGKSSAGIIIAIIILLVIVVVGFWFYKKKFKKAKKPFDLLKIAKGKKEELS